MSSKHTALDAAILEAIRLGARTFGAIEDTLRVAARREAGTKQARYPTLREIDSRLQALRKLKRVAYSRAGGWVLVDWRGA